MPHPETISDILDTKTQSILGSVTTGSCVLVDPDDFSPRAKPISEQVELTSSDARLLAKLLLDFESWFFATKRCLPKNTAVIELGSPIGRAKVLIGMVCADWEISANGVRKSAFFDPVAAEVRGILKRAFPDIASADPRCMWKGEAIAKLKQSAVQRQHGQAISPEGNNRIG